MKAAVYCRLALKDDELMEIQISKVSLFAKENGYDDVAVYVDNGASGNNFYNPALIRLMEDISAAKINTVFIRSVDRICRDALRLEYWLNWATRKEVLVKAMDRTCGDETADTYSEILSSIEKGGGLDGAEE